jgi:hypothetical protein
MGKVKGSMNFGANFNIEAEGPIDARTVVESLADLTNANTWVENSKNLNPYKGMTVNVLQDGSQWMLTGATQTDIKSWKRLDGGGKGELVLSGSSTVSISTATTSAKTTYTFTSPKVTVATDSYLSGTVTDSGTSGHALSLSANVLTTSATVSTETATGKLADAKAIKDLVNTVSSNTISSLTKDEKTRINTFKNVVINSTSTTFSAAETADTITFSGSSTATLRPDTTNKQITFSSPKVTVATDSYLSGTVTDSGTSGHALSLSANVLTTSAAVSTETATGKLADAKAIKDYTDKKVSDLSGTTNSAVTGITLKLSGGTSDTNVKEEYYLYDTINKTQRGPSIKIYKDSALQSVYLGHVDDKLSDTTSSAVTSGTGDTALSFIYLLTDGKYSLTNIDVSQFYEDAKFDSGVTVNDKHIVHGVVANKGDGYLHVDGDGFYVSGITNAIKVAIEGLDNTADEKESGNTYVYKVTQNDGIISVVHKDFSGLSISVPSAKKVDNTLTISAKSGVTSGFSTSSVKYNGSATTTMNITIPTKLSHLTDDISSGITAGTASKVAKSITFQSGSTSGFTSNSYNGSSALTINIPTKLSDLANDALTGGTLSGTNGNEATIQELVDYYTFEQSSTTAATVAGLSSGASVIVVTNTSSTWSELNFSSGFPSTGIREYHILVNNMNSSALTIGLTNYKSTVGDSFKIPANSWGEINVLVVAGTAYVRATA